jgi:hypothetical protein
MSFALMDMAEPAGGKAPQETTGNIATLGAKNSAEGHPIFR